MDPYDLKTKSKEIFEQEQNLISKIKHYYFPVLIVIVVSPMYCGEDQPN